MSENKSYNREKLDPPLTTPTLTIKISTSEKNKQLFRRELSRSQLRLSSRTLFLLLEKYRFLMMSLWRDLLRK